MVKRPFLWSLGWILFSLCVNFLFYLYGSLEQASAFFAGYIIEKLLSIDNIFLFFIIFETFSLPLSSQVKVLFWGILSAFVLRFLLIIGGLELLKLFHWLIYPLSFLLAASAFLCWVKQKDAKPPRWLAWIAKKGKGEKTSSGFWYKKKPTSLFWALCAVEFADIIFALDSIPAIIAITQDPLVIYTSNLCAMLSLRSIYFLLHKWSYKLVFFKKGVSFILLFVAVKLFFSDIYPISLFWSLVVIILILGGIVLLSFFAPKERKKSA